MNPNPALTFISPLLAFFLAPLLPGTINRIKANFAGRTGQPWLQAYYDIFKLLQKGSVYSHSTSWVFRAGPVVGIAALGCAAFLVPLGRLGAPLAFSGDLLFFVYLLGLGRFFTVIAALDTSSSFEGMGAKREVFYAALAEPVLLLGLLALARNAQSVSLSRMLGDGPPFGFVTTVLIGASMFVVMLAENARIPFDDPNTHLELTMIHEVMVLDHSGVDLAYINYGMALKLWLTGLLVARTVLPFRAGNLPLDIFLTLLTMAIISVIVGVVESTMARLRLAHVPQLLIGAGALAVIGLMFGSMAIL